MPPNEDGDDLEYLKRLDGFFSGKEQTTLYFELEKRNWAPNHSDNLTDEEVSQALTNLIWSLRDVHVYIEYSDHLSDRELYAQLLDYCDEPTACVAGMANAGMHWSPIGSWSDEDMQVWLQFYATEDERTEHAEKYPEDPMPPSELPAYPRPWIPVREFPVYEDDEEDSA